MFAFRLRALLDRWRLRIHSRYFARFLFVHINKTGGMSVEEALGLPTRQHKTALEFVEMIGIRRWRQLFTFAVVRNPWDRVVSHYLYRIQTAQTGMGENPPAFRDWVRLTYAEQDPRYYDDVKFFAPQCAWLADESGQILVDQICRLESIDRDFAVVCEALGIQVKLKHLNRTDRRPYREYYDDETRAIVAEWFHRDIELFGYRY